VTDGARCAFALHQLIDALEEHRRRRLRLAEELHGAWGGPSATRHRTACTDRAAAAALVVADLHDAADRLAALDPFLPA